MVKQISLLCLLSFLFMGCTDQPAAAITKPKENPRVTMAKEIIARSDKFTFANYHISGVKDSATAQMNINAAAAGYASKRSAYGRSPGGYTYLQTNMLSGMLKLANMGYSIRVSEIAGGEHSSRSRHYLGVAYDVTHINGVKVSWNNPFYREYMRKARALGATEVLGPGDKGHSGHLHISWPRPSGQ